MTTFPICLGFGAVRNRTNTRNQNVMAVQSRPLSTTSQEHLTHMDTHTDVSSHRTLNLSFHQGAGNASLNGNVNNKKFTIIARCGLGHHFSFLPSNQSITLLWWRALSFFLSLSLLKKETVGPPADLWPSEVSIHRIPRCHSSEPLLGVSGFTHIHVAPGRGSAPSIPPGSHYIPAIKPTGSISEKLPIGANIQRMNKRLPFWWRLWHHRRANELLWNRGFLFLFYMFIWLSFALNWSSWLFHYFYNVIFKLVEK